jgi:hypothetical protein
MATPIIRTCITGMSIETEATVPADRGAQMDFEAISDGYYFGTPLTPFGDPGSGVAK